MQALRLALSFMSIGRLFVSLLFWPMVVGLFIALGQLFVSSAYIQLVNETPDEFEERLATRSPDTLWMKEYLFGPAPLTGAPQVCRWEQSGNGEQLPAGCSLDRLDVVLRSNTPLLTDTSQYELFFRDSTRRIHVCETCETDIVISVQGEQTISNVYSIFGMGVLALTDSANYDQISSHFVEAKLASERLKNLGGTVYLHPPGLSKPVNMTEATKTMILIINTALMIVITLWLSLKGHRKVLDYFARNDALLPLVASCGKDTFYAALWIITLVRVAFFLLMVIPPTVILYSRTLSPETLSVFIGEPADFVLWLMAIMTSLCSLTIVASIAELKHRHSWVSFMYRYVPLAVCVFGSFAWGLTLVIESTSNSFIQNVISTIPILGISPVLLRPLISMSPTVLVAHSVLASILVVLVLRLNSRWFAAHLEEI